MAKTYGGEIKRKFFHLSSLSIPILYTWVPKEIAVVALLAATLVFFGIDMLRFYSVRFRKVFHILTDSVIREKEHHSFTGSTWILLGSTLCVAVFPKAIAQAAVTFIVIGDIAAALIGRKWGRHRIFGGKSLEGTVAFAVSTIIAGFCIPGLTPQMIIPGAVLGAVVEVAPIPLDDNFTVPIAVGLLMLGISLL